MTIQWIATTGIAFFVALIGYFQWITAHQRVVLDLFDRRFDVYGEIRSGIGSIVTSGKVSPEVEQKIGRAIETARFYFGTEVISYLDQLWRSMIDLSHYESAIEGTEGTDRAALIEKRRSAFEKIAAFYKDGPLLFAPYIRLDQKMRSLWWPFSA